MLHGSTPGLRYLRCKVTLHTPLLRLKFFQSLLIEKTEKLGNEINSYILSVLQSLILL